MPAAPRDARHALRMARVRPAVSTVAVAVIVALAAACGGQSGQPQSTAHAASTNDPPRPLQISFGQARLVIPAIFRSRLARDRPAGARRALTWWLSRHTAIRTRLWTVVLTWSHGDREAVMAAIRSPGDRVAMPDAVTATQLRLPVIRQVWRNNCETAALSMMLRGRVSQQRLQSMLPVSRPYRMQDTDSLPVWGDPNLGFVGPATGGGYGVYHGPLLHLAQRFDPGTTDLTHTSVDRVIDALRSGRPVVAWIQLGSSIPVTWKTPAGAIIHANWSEHAVTLTGWRPGTIIYNNPWTGTTEQFTITGFATVWNTLGDQAIAGTSLITNSR